MYSMYVHIHVHGACVTVRFMKLASSYPIKLYTTSSSITTLPYLDKDQLGGYTMLSGDIVLFNVAIDQRNGDQRATNVQVHKLIEEQKDRNAREMVSCFSLHSIFWG